MFWNSMLRHSLLFSSAWYWLGLKEDIPRLVLIFKNFKPISISLQKIPSALNNFLLPVVKSCPRKWAFHSVWKLHYHLKKKKRVTWSNLAQNKNYVVRLNGQSKDEASLSFITFCPLVISFWAFILLLDPILTSPY
jgi:hypothetical protein